MLSHHRPACWHQSQSGSAAIIIAIVLALGLSAALIVAGDKTKNVVAAAKVDDGLNRAAEANISAVAYVKASTQYRKVNSFVQPSGITDPGPDPTDPSALPALYPDPYYSDIAPLQAGPLAPVIAKPAGALWSYSPLLGGLTIAFPGADQMRGSDFQEFVQQGKVPSQAAALTAKVSSTGIMMPTSPRPWLVAGLQLTVATQAKGVNGWAHTSTAQIDLPRPAHPRCTLVGPSTPVGPNQVVPIKAMIAGVASRIYFPDTQAANVSNPNDISPFFTDKTLIPPYHSGSNYQYQDLRGITNSVRNTTPILATTFNITTPRILAVVDGSSATVPIWLTAYVVAPDDTEHQCEPVQLLEENVADCRLSLDNYTLQAAPAGSPAPAMPQQTCSTPATGKNQKASTALACTTTTTSPVATPSAENPQGLAACAQLSYALLGVYDKATFKTQVLDPAGKDVTAQTLVNGGKSFCPQPGAVGPFRLLATVSGKNNKGQPSQCTAQVDVSNLGPNTASATPATPGKGQQCPLFFGGVGAKLQPTCQAISGAIDYFGEKSTWSDSKFCPQQGLGGNQRFAFEVAAIALSPLQVAPCPKGARCFGIGTNGQAARNLFVVINQANSPACYAVGQSRTNLGCFAGSTQIRMGDGSQKSVAYIKVGDTVWNPTTRQAAVVSAVSAGVESLPLMRLETAAGEHLRLTLEHPVPTGRGLLKARDVRVGDVIQQADGPWRTVIFAAPEAQNYNDIVYNLKIAPTNPDAAAHMLEADGLIAGDLYLQEQLHNQLPDAARLP